MLRNFASSFCLALALAGAGKDTPKDVPDLGEQCLQNGELVLNAPAEKFDAKKIDGLLRSAKDLLGIYLTVDFESFRRFHGKDWDFACAQRQDLVSRLKEFFVQELGGNATDSLPKDLTELLRQFWARLYTKAPILKYLPDSAKIQLGYARVEAEKADEWVAGIKSSAPKTNALFPKSVTNNLAIPHRRSVKQIILEEGEILWVDWKVDVSFNSGKEHVGFISLRFFWDESDQEWFLGFAKTFYPAGYDGLAEKNAILF